jgi:uncharacterized membrane protein HdeD (DUF308 family)
MKRNVAFWITLIRGILAISLGTALLIQPDKPLPMLANFMGMYWLVAGIMSLRWGASGERARGFPVLAGVIGIMAGLGMLSRRLAPSYVAEEVFFSVLGLVILLTGLLHIFGGFRKSPSQAREWSWTSFLLGLFEVILGLMLVVSPLTRDVWVYMAAGIWALIGGAILITDALRLRRLNRRKREDNQVSPPAETG